MNAQEYIENKIEELSLPIEFINIADKDLKDELYSRIMSKKFRKLKADNKIKENVKVAVEYAVSNNKPISFNQAFGGNKLWRLREAPEIDWAELFNVIYISNWMLYICQVYKPGVIFEYFSEDLVLKKMNNLDPLETNQYSLTFIEMLNWIKKYLPKNIVFTYRRYKDEYKNYQDFIVELETAKQKVLSENSGKLPILSEAQNLAVEMNAKPTKVQLQDPNWRQKVELIHQSIERTISFERYYNNLKNIPVCPTKYDGLIVTGSTKKSYAKFWVGVGALEKTVDSFNEIIVTPKQLENAKFDWQEVILQGLKGKNFNKIRVSI